MPENELAVLYEKCGYQKLASNFSFLGLNSHPSSKYEDERFEYIRDNVEFKDKKIIDIGGNTGYFSFEAYNKGAISIDYYEGDSKSAEFMKTAVDFFGFNISFAIHNVYYDFAKIDKTKIYDIGFFLNVAHHLGGNSGDEVLESKEEAKKKMISVVNDMSRIIKLMVFQIGFNWRGNTSENLFEHGTKKEMIDWISDSTQDYWEISRIGVAERDKNNIRYIDKSEKNLERDDSLGEFLNRPIFIMHSKVCNTVL